MPDPAARGPADPTPPAAAPWPAPLVVSYLTLRRAVGLTGLALPVVLVLGGWLAGVPVQDDVSSYYHTPLRDVFVGTLVAAAAFLFCYRGRDRVENLTANLGGVAALCVAFFPIDPDSAPPYQRTAAGFLHTAGGGAFFLVLAFYSLVHFPRGAGDDEVSEDGREPPDAARHRRRNLVYILSGVVILLSVPAMGAYLFLLPAAWRETCDDWNALFWLEATAAWAFAAAWLTKGRAIGAELALDLLTLAETRLREGRQAARRGRA